jgi:hypothetical protein
MIIKNLHYAVIVDNDSQNSSDGTKNGSVKIRIPYMMNGLKDSELPWALPFQSFTGGSDSHGISSIPEENSLVWVFFYDEKLHKNPYYISGINLKDFTPAELFEDNVKSSISGYSSSYPDNKFIYLANGVCLVISSNSSTPEIAIYHPEGAYIFINSSGEIHLKGANGTLEFSVLGETLKTVLEGLVDQIKTGVAPSGGGTVTYATIDAWASTNLPTILSQSVKNN